MRSLLLVIVVVVACGCGAEDDDTSSGVDCRVEASVCPDDEVCAPTHYPEAPGSRFCGEPCDLDGDCSEADFVCCAGACMHINTCAGE